MSLPTSLLQVIILDSERPKDVYHFLYGGWIARDEGDGKLWREINAKKKLPNELKHGRLFYETLHIERAMTF